MENLQIKINVSMFKQKLYKKLNLKYSELDEKDDKIIYCKIRQVDHKATGTLIAVDNILRDAEYPNLKGPKTALIKKTFDPIIIRNSEKGDFLIRQTYELVCKFSEPIRASVIPIVTFDHDFNTRLE